MILWKLVLTVIVPQEILREDNLVKQVPIALVAQGTDTPVQDVPPGIEA